MQHASTFVIIGLLILFGIYRRTRRTIGFQKFKKGSMITRMILLTIVGILFLAMGYLNPMVYIYDVLGMILGGVIAYYAIRTTSFEWRKDAWFYRPHPWIGILLFVLFIGRIAYRVYQDYVLFGATAAVSGQPKNIEQLATYSHDPSTTAIFFTLIIYYIVYYTFLISKEKHLEKES